MIQVEGRQVGKLGVGVFHLPPAKLPPNIQVITDIAVSIHLLLVKNLKKLQIHGFRILYVV